MKKQNTVTQLELSDEDLSLIREAAYHVGKPVFQFVTEASVERAKQLLEWKRRVEAGELSCGCKIDACICDFA